MDATTTAVTLFAGAGVGAVITSAAAWMLRDKQERRKGAVLGRQVALLTASLAVMLFIVEEKSQTEFDARLLPELMALLRSPEFLGFVEAKELVDPYSALTVIEVQHLQFERIYPRFVDLHARAILGHLVEPEDAELRRIEVSLRDFAKIAREALDKEVQPGLSRIVHRLEARSKSLWGDVADDLE